MVRPVPSGGDSALKRVEFDRPTRSCQFNTENVGARAHGDIRVWAAENDLVPAICQASGKGQLVNGGSVICRIGANQAAGDFAHGPRGLGAKGHFQAIEKRFHARYVGRDLQHVVQLMPLAANLRRLLSQPPSAYQSPQTRARRQAILCVLKRHLACRSSAGRD